jgi:hypothetical protein
MKRAILPLSLAFLLATVLLLAQPQRPRPATTPSGQYPQWEVKVLEPHEVAAGRYQQVRPYELDELASDGWELVAMTNFVLRNEEHEGPKGERPMVTQAYQSYAFKRLKRDQVR